MNKIFSDFMESMETQSAFEAMTNAMETSYKIGLIVGSNSDNTVDINFLSELVNADVEDVEKFVKTSYCCRNNEEDKCCKDSVRRKKKAQHTIDLNKYQIGWLSEDELQELANLLNCNIAYDYYADENFGFPSKDELTKDGEVLGEERRQDESWEHYFCRLRDTIECLV